MAVDAGGCAFFAGEGVSGALGACIAGLGLTALADITSALVVFDAVAVVVKIVAGFGAWSDFAEASSPDTRRTGLQAFFTDTFSFGPCGAAITIAGNVFVDFAVAIVVFVVADLDVGFDLPNACAPDPVVAGFFAFFADAALIGSCGSIVTIAVEFSAKRVVVDLSVAVVVFAVADLGRRGDLVEARRPLACGLADPFAACAKADACGICRAVIANFFLSNKAFTSAATDQVIGLTVAIVVFSVANFSICGFCITGFPCSIAASFFAGVATALTGASQAIVDFSVAIVIFAVALLDLGGDLSCAVLPLAIGTTGLFALGARSDALGVWGACVAVAGSCGGALAAFVGGAVAIVVDVVAAFFRAWSACVTGLELPVLADLFAESALRLTAFFDVVVDFSVAIVVFAVAYFGLGKGLLQAFAP